MTLTNTIVIDTGRTISVHAKYCKILCLGVKPTDSLRCLADEDNSRVNPPCVSDAFRQWRPTLRRILERVVKKLQNQAELDLEELNCPRTINVHSLFGTTK